MSGGFFRGTSADQDSRFSDKNSKLLKSQKFPSELEQPVDMSRVKKEVMLPWIAKRVTELLGVEDEVLVNFISSLLEGKKVDGKKVQIQLTGFLEKHTFRFMKELWCLLLSAQRNISGIPQKFLDEKAEEVRKQREDDHSVLSEIGKRRGQQEEVAEVEAARRKAAEAAARLSASLLGKPVDEAKIAAIHQDKVLAAPPSDIPTENGTDEKKNTTEGVHDAQEVKPEPEALAHDDSTSLQRDAERSAEGDDDYRSNTDIKQERRTPTRVDGHGQGGHEASPRSLSFRGRSPPRQRDEGRLSFRGDRRREDQNGRDVRGPRDFYEEGNREYRSSRSYAYRDDWPRRRLPEERGRGPGAGGGYGGGYDDGRRGTSFRGPGGYRDEGERDRRDLGRREYYERPGRQYEGRDSRGWRSRPDAGPPVDYEERGRGTGFRGDKPVSFSRKEQDFYEDDWEGRGTHRQEKFHARGREAAFGDADCVNVKRRRAIEPEDELAYEDEHEGGERGWEGPKKAAGAVSAGNTQGATLEAGGVDEAEGGGMAAGEGKVTEDENLTEEERKELKRKRKEEKRIRKEEKRRRKEEKRKRKEEKRAAKEAQKLGSAPEPGSQRIVDEERDEDEDDEDDEEYEAGDGVKMDTYGNEDREDARRVEEELRHRAMASLKAKKVKGYDD